MLKNLLLTLLIFFISLSYADLKSQYFNIKLGGSVLDNGYIISNDIKNGFPVYKYSGSSKNLIWAQGPIIEIGQDWQINNNLFWSYSLGYDKVDYVFFNETYYLLPVDLGFKFIFDQWYFSCAACKPLFQQGQFEKGELTGSEVAPAGRIGLRLSENVFLEYKYTEYNLSSRIFPAQITNKDYDKDSDSSYYKSTLKRNIIYIGIMF